MKRKNILKFVSLLGIGSFVMLAAASCTSATTPTPNPEPKPTPNPEPNPMPNPGGGDMNNPPSGGMNGGDTNPGNDGGMDNATQQLAAAKKELSDLLATQNSNLASYADYAKIQNTLTSAYTTAKSTSDNTSATLEQVKSATSTLQTTIDAAASEKKTFDAANPELIKFYNNLKTELQSKTTNLESLNDPQYSGIKDNLNSLYNSASEIVNKTLIPATGNDLMRTDVEKVNTELMGAVSSLAARKTSAENLFSAFDKNVLVKTNLTAGNGSQVANDQPGNYSFVAFSVNAVTASDNLPNWNFAQRRVWDSATAPLATTTTENGAQPEPALTDVSWIYNLTGTGAKYSFTFNYFGPRTGYLYFPYKLVNSSQSDKVGLQYKLNEGSVQAITFAPTTPASAVSEPTHTPTEMASSNEMSVANNDMAVVKEANPTPTVNDIKVAKVSLSNLNFGENTIEFSVPSGDGIVAPMIGNMYLTSNPANTDKIYNSIFGNSIADNNTITVDLLKGYSLSTSYSIYIRRFTGLQEAHTTDPVYLVGWIGGNGARNNDPSIRNVNSFPVVNNQERVFTIYVNAPTAGEYNISGSYISTMSARSLNFSTSNGTSNNSVTILVTAKTDWTTLGTFDTASNTTTTTSRLTNSKKTLNLQKGLNKIVISGVSGVANGNTPYIGNLTFTLNTTTQENAEHSTSEAPASSQPKQ
ncbi:variably expressed lipoprotein and hemagglutinin (VlhA) family protein [Mycoplasmoides gallisepticum CA06_2006.052-5-2P]|uniref:FIVAR domain-containing protein n=1 Tax=Mycoplasmoides gallisepticum TaxID=2096 RepID=UPI0002778E56|nr:FIVAR domain-containing protein [Mycoplasmoides gallisepticum]AFP80916.1 variably expressed lipoprotein and hemagglutinin (VlhA) family protein [Mycoplasmoides gallisepticum CA06_2006.052-5-2P]